MELTEGAEHCSVSLRMTDEGEGVVSSFFSNVIDHRGKVVQGELLDVVVCRGVTSARW